MKRRCVTTMRDTAIDWLLYSGIIDRTVGSPTYGAFHYGFDPISGSHLQTYSEITGYGISLFVQLARGIPDGPFLNMAINAANHLIGIQCDERTNRGTGSFPHGRLPSSHAVADDCFSFDTAICLSGLVDLYRATAYQPLLEPIKRAATWLSTEATRPDGSFYARFSRREGQFRPLGPDAYWYDDSCSLHAKNAIGLIKAADLLDDDSYRRAAVRVLDWVLPMQNRFGAFVVKPGVGVVSSHVHAYVTEALLFAAARGTGRQELYREAAERAVLWLFGRRNRDGSLDRFYPRHSSTGEVVTDATAQALRLFLVMRNDVYRVAMEEILVFLRGRQWKHYPWPTLWGSFRSNSRRIGPVYFPSLKTMCWPTLFAIHACQLFLESGSPSDLW